MKISSDKPKFEAPKPPSLPSAADQPECCGLDNWEPSFDPSKLAITTLPADKGNAGITTPEFESEE